MNEQKWVAIFEKHPDSIVKQIIMQEMVVHVCQVKYKSPRIYWNVFDTFYQRLIIEARLHVYNLYVSFQAESIAEMAKTNKHWMPVEMDENRLKRNFRTKSPTLFELVTRRPLKMSRESKFVSKGIIQNDFY